MGFRGGVAGRNDFGGQPAPSPDGELAEYPSGPPLSFVRKATSLDRSEPRDAREILHEALVQIDLTRSEGMDTEQAAEFSRNLADGDWWTIKYFEHSGRRYYLAHDDAVGFSHPLTLREQQALCYAELGHSNKLIAHSLGLSPSTISTLLERARKKASRALPSKRRTPIGSTRLMREQLEKARVTRIGPTLLLLSVLAEATLDASAAGCLTAAERAVVELTLSGLSNVAIASKRQCSPRTVANQLAVAYKKLGISSRRELRARFGP